VIAGVVAHSAELALAVAATADAVAAELRWERARFWLLPVALLALLAVVHVLGAAGAISDRPYDDDGHVVAQLRRLVDTGALADPIGYARGAQLGGHAGLAGLVGAFGDVRTARYVDGGLGFALVLALALARIRPRDAASAIWATLLVVLASAVTIRWGELVPLWIPAGLLVATYVSLERAEHALPIGLLAGAAAAMRGELIAPAIVLVIAAWWPRRGDRARLVALAAAGAVACVPYLVARALAWRTVDASAHALLEPTHAGLAARLGLFALVALAVLPLVLLPTRELGDMRLRWLALAAAAGLAAIAGQLGVERPFATHFVWTFAIAGFVAIAIELAAARQLARTALVVALLVSVLVFDGHELMGRFGWSGRYLDLIADAEYLRHCAAGDDAPYAAAFAAIPPGDTVAVWVSRPEALDYARHRIVDLRTPRAARLRVPDASDTRLDKLLTASHARWLVLEADDQRVARGNASGLYAFLCWRAFDWCADSLEVLVQRHRVVAEQGGVRVLALP
jgi:hypothetical protein